MRFILTPAGSHGDVHPYVGIGRALRGRGHEVLVMTAEPFRELAESSQLEFVPTVSAEYFESLTENPDLWHPQRGLALVMSSMAERIAAGYELLSEHYRPGDILVGHLLSFSPRVFQDKHGVPSATLHLAPSSLRSAHRLPALVPGRDLSGWPLPVKRALNWMIDRFVIDRHVAGPLNELRRSLDLEPVSRPFAHWVNSPQRVIALFPEWFGARQPDWPDQLVHVGFPLYDEAGRHALDPALESFLGAARDKGGAIALTPGSANRHGSEFFEAGIGAAARLGRPALCLTGYPEQLPEPLPDFVFHSRYAPFSEVFPRCCLVAHHGGIGTCGQALAAGIPQLVMPLGFDQPDNVTRLHELGVADWLVPGKFRPGAVAEKVERLTTSPLTRRACDEFRDALAGQDAVGRACDLLEALGNPV